MQVFLGMILGALLLVAGVMCMTPCRRRPSPTARSHRPVDHRELGCREADWHALKARAREDWSEDFVEVTGVLSPTN